MTEDAWIRYYVEMEQGTIEDMNEKQRAAYI